MPGARLPDFDLSGASRAEGGLILGPFGNRSVAALRPWQNPQVSKGQMIARARRLILRHGWNATAYQILNPGMERWFSSCGEGLVGYVECSGYRVVAGGPVCAPEKLAEVVQEFEADTHRRGLWTCYFAADERLAEVLAARGPWDRILLGAQPVWQPSHWPEILGAKASLRAQLNRARNKGVVVRLGATELSQKKRAELLQCLKEWLATRGLPPLHFLVEPETLDRLYDRRVYLAEIEGKVVAFLVASPVPERRGWLVEQTIRGREAPNGSSELLLDAAMRDLAKTGAEYLTLGLSPLSRRAGLAGPQRLWLRLLLAWTRAHGRRFYNFDGLDAYKAKFLPESWEPIYAITSERRVGLGTLYAIAGAFGKMSPVVLLFRAVGRALGRELGWFRRRWSS